MPRRKRRFAQVLFFVVGWPQGPFIPAATKGEGEAREGKTRQTLRAAQLLRSSCAAPVSGMPARSLFFFFSSFASFFPSAAARSPQRPAPEPAEIPFAVSFSRAAKCVCCSFGRNPRVASPLRRATRARPARPAAALVVVVVTLAAAAAANRVLFQGAVPFSTGSLLPPPAQRSAVRAKSRAARPQRCVRALFVFFSCLPR